MNESTMTEASKTSHRSRHSSSRNKKEAKSRPDPHQMMENAADPPSTNSEGMARSIRPPSDIKIRQRKKIKQSLVLATLAAAKAREQKNDLSHSSDDLSQTEPTSHEDTHTLKTTLCTTCSSLENNTKTESRHPSPARDKSDKTRNQGEYTSEGVDGSSIKIIKGGHSRGGSKGSCSTAHSLSDGTAASSLRSRPSRSDAASRKTAASTTSTKVPDIKLSSERLEVLVMQLRETADEKEAATVILEFALRIKNHELVIQGADLSIINAMKRFSNSSKIQTRGCKALAEMASKGMHNIVSIIDKGGADIILTAMAKHRAEEDLQKEACRAIEYIARESDQGKQSFGANAKDAISAILHAMKDHIGAAKIQRMACRALASIAEDHRECGQSLVNRGGLDAIRRTLRHHDDNTDVIENAFDVLINVAASVKDSALDEQMAMTVSMDRVLATMLLFRRNDKIQSQGMALLCMLCKRSPRNRSKIASLYGLEVITKSLENCTNNKEVQRTGTTLIQFLSQTEGNSVAAGLVSEGGMELLLNILRRHGSDPIIVQQVNLIIAKMARPFSDLIRKEGGIELILSGMRRHEANAIVQESACLALSKLSAKTENANVITGNGGIALINNALSRFAANENISEVACEALALLSHDEQILLAQHTLKARAAHKKPESSWGQWNCGVSCF